MAAVVAVQAATARPTRVGAAAAPRLAARSVFAARLQTRRPAARSLRVFAAEEVATKAGPVNDDTFEAEVLNSPLPVLVDFWAPWCGPCRMIAPLVDELAAEYAGKLKVVKLNTDESPNTATQYGIRSIPTVMVFKNGQKMDAIIGAVPKGSMVQTIEKYLA